MDACQLLLCDEAVESNRINMQCLQPILVACCTERRLAVCTCRCGRLCWAGTWGNCFFAATTTALNDCVFLAKE